MKCQDVRRTLSPFVDGQLALTEWAIIQGHLLECAECPKELDRLRALADTRARAKHRHATETIVAAMAVVLVVAAGGGFFIYQGSFDLPSWGMASAPPVTAAPATPALELANPVVPVPVPHPVPAPAARPSPPPPARPKGTSEATPWGTAPPAAEPIPRATRPAAIAEAPAEDRMPTQARPVPSPTAPPDAEAMPTQGGPARPLPRSRP